MQRSRFRVEEAAAEDDFGWMAGGRTKRITADVALTGSAVPYHTLPVVAGQSYAIRAVSFVALSATGFLWTGLGPASPAQAALIWLSFFTRKDAVGALELQNGTGTGLVQTAATITATGTMQVVMDGYFDCSVSGDARITHAVTAGAAGILKAGSFATIHRLS